MSWISEAGKLLPKVNWPAAFVVVAGIALYAFVLAPDYATQDEVEHLLEAQTEELKDAIQCQSTTDAVHGNTIETIHRVNSRQDEELRELRRNP